MPISNATLGLVQSGEQIARLSPEAPRDQVIAAINELIERLNAGVDNQPQTLEQKTINAEDNTITIQTADGGIVSMLAAPGDITISGLDFQPSLVEITLAPPDDVDGTTNTYVMVGIATTSGQSSTGMSKNSAAHTAYRWTSTTKAVYVVGATGTNPLMEGEVTITTDGFVIAMTTVTGVTDSLIWRAWR